MRADDREHVHADTVAFGRLVMPKAHEPRSDKDHRVSENCAEGDDGTPHTGMLRRERDQLALGKLLQWPAHAEPVDRD